MTKRIQKCDVKDLKEMYDDLTRMGDAVQALHIRMSNMLGKSQKYSKGMQRAHDTIWTARYELWKAASITLDIDLDEPIETIETPDLDEPLHVAMPWDGKPTTAAGEQANPWD